MRGFFPFGLAQGQNDKRKQTTPKTTAKSRSPFGFAQGRLCGNDNQKSNGNNEVTAGSRKETG